MTGISPQLMVLLASTGAGVWMIVAGVQKSALEWRRPKRRCPSCGRAIVGRSCSCNA